MVQAHKKSTASHSAAKSAGAANKTTKSPFAAGESTRSSAENVVKMGGKAVKDFMNSSAGEAQKAQEKVFAIGREGAAHISKSADAVTKALYEAVTLSRDSVETCIECGNISASLAKDVSTELFESANQTFSDNIELSKEALNCRTFNDVFELQNRLVRSAIDNFFNQSVKLSGMMFEYTTEALEPINERVAEATDKINKVLAVK